MPHDAKLISLFLAYEYMNSNGWKARCSDSWFQYTVRLKERWDINIGADVSGVQLHSLTQHCQHTEEFLTR